MERVPEDEVGKGEAAVHDPPSPQGTTYALYPPALATYEDVIADPKLFRETLEKLHATLGTKFMIPTVGGKELNLHKLFVDVTSRGGIEKVIRERKLKEITSGFNFPPTATNASFVLRKYYLSLLNHYEQIYFFKSKGWNSPAPGLTPSPGQGPVHKSDEHLPLLQDSHNLVMKRQRTTNDPLLSGGIASQPQQYPLTVRNHPVVGVIDGKFEHGYLVTIRVREKVLRGIVYHVSEDAAAQLPYNFGNIIGGGRRRRRRKKLSKLDPTHPKPNRSGYNFFFAEQHARLKQIHSGKDREISKMIGDLWNKLTDAEKAVYQEIGLRDKERYQSEMAVYRERQKMGPLLISNAVPIQQRAAAEEVPLPNMDPKVSADGGNSQSSSSDSDGSSTESDSEMEESPEATIGADSTSIADDSQNGTNDYELRIRDSIEKENEAAIAGPSEEPEVANQDSTEGGSLS